MNPIVRYFDLNSERRGPKPEAAIEDADTKFHWLPQYLALLVGIIVQPYFQAYMKSGAWDISGFWGWLIGSIVIALMAFPAIYKNTFDPTKPLFVQLCVIFTSGMGWQTVISTALKAANVDVGA